MGIVRHVVLSDLHLGALNSLLTNVSDDGLSVSRSHMEPTLSALGECLRALRVGDPPAQLVVLGDMAELALTPLEDAASAIGMFARATRLGERDGAFAPVIRYIAGNHDHYLWTRARIDHDQHLLDTANPSKAIPRATHVTPMFPGSDDDVKGRFLASVARWALPGTTIDVRHSYPNFGLVTADRSRAIVMHHGHFVEHLYRIVSSIDDIFDSTSEADQPMTSAHLERDNGGWIDFFWSSEGDSGDAGNDVRMVYESLVSGKTIDAELDRIVTVMTRRRRGLSGRIVAASARRMLTSAHGVLAWRERHDASGVLSADADRGLNAYLAGPVRTDLQRELTGVPSDVSFLFGHTHKPFVGTRAVQGYTRPVELVNTGGWVVDHMNPEPFKGGTIALIDDDLNIVALECFRQSPDGGATTPRVIPVGRQSVAFARQITATIGASRPAWAEFSAACSSALVKRRRGLKRREDATQARLRAASR